MRRLRSILSVVVSGILAAGTVLGGIGGGAPAHASRSDAWAADAVHALPAAATLRADRGSAAGAPHRTPSHSGAALPAPSAVVSSRRDRGAGSAAVAEQPIAAPRASGYDATAPPVLNG